MVTTILMVVFQGLTAVGAVAIVWQLWLSRGVAKFDTLHRLRLAFTDSRGVGEFHEAARAAVDNTNEKVNFVDVLCNTAKEDPWGHRLHAERCAEFYQYLFCCVDNGVVRARDAVQVLGARLNEYYDLGKDIEASFGDANKERFDRLFPKLPKAVERELARWKARATNGPVASSDVAA